MTLSPLEDDAEPAADGTITLPAEALLRLVYGRLDEAHTPPTTAEGSKTIDDVRPLFHGF